MFVYGIGFARLLALVGLQSPDLMSLPHWLSSLAVGKQFLGHEVSFQLTSVLELLDLAAPYLRKRLIAKRKYFGDRREC